MRFKNLKLIENKNKKYWAFRKKCQLKMVGKSQQQKNDNAGGYSKEVESFLPLIVFLIEKKLFGICT